MIDLFNDESMAPSRYFDHPITASYFIVTSPYAPKDFYEEFASREEVKTWIDTFDQLARRLFLVQEMTPTEMSLYFYDDQHQEFEKDASTTKPNPHAKKISSEIEERQAVLNLFNKLTEKNETNEVEK